MAPSWPLVFLAVWGLTVGGVHWSQSRTHPNVWICGWSPGLVSPGAYFLPLCTGDRGGGGSSPQSPVSGLHAPTQCLTRVLVNQKLYPGDKGGECGDPPTRRILVHRSGDRSRAKQTVPRIAFVGSRAPLVGIRVSRMKY